MSKAEWTDESFQAGNKGKMTILFHPVQVKNKYRSEIEKRPVFEEQIFITKIPPGAKDLIIDRKMREKDKEDFPAAWEHWERTHQNRIPGMPIESWPAISDTQKAELRALNIFTVEQFANLTDASADKIMGFHALRAKARVFIEMGKDAELIGRIRRETEETLAEQRLKMLSQDRELQELRAMLQQIPRGPRRRRAKKSRKRSVRVPVPAEEIEQKGM